jgi:hypothetical protein
MCVVAAPEYRKVGDAVRKKCTRKVGETHEKVGTGKKSLGAEGARSWTNRRVCGINNIRLSAQHENYVTNTNDKKW